MAGAATKIIEVCEAEFQGAKDDCNKFVKAVASHFGISLTGNANSIIDQITSPGWTKLRDGKKAAEMAALGSFVVGGLKGKDQTKPSLHGHVVVVVRGPLNRSKYPSAYWGRLGGSGEKNRTINWAWPESDRDKVVYGAKKPASAGA